MSKEYDSNLSNIAGYNESAFNAVHIKTLATVERIYIEEVIAYCSGNIPRAAKLLDVSPSTIYRKQAQWARETH